MAVEVATAYVSLVPSARGFSSNLESELGGSIDASSVVLGERLASGMFGKLASSAAIAGIAVGTALAAGVTAAGVGLFKIGDTFDSAFDKVRVTTGKTGDELKGLEGSFNKVFTNVPASAGQVSDAISTLNVKLGLTGQPLEGLAIQMLNLSHITGTDLKTNLQSATDVFNSFGIAAADQPAKLDELFRTTQLTGVGFSELSAGMARAGPNLKQLGLNFEQSSALVGLFSKAGLDVGEALPFMSRTIVTAAKAGKDAGDVFRETFDRIKNAPSDTEAAGAAIDTFGARAGPKLAGLIRQGKLSYDDLAKSIADGSDTINKATVDTNDFSEKWGMFKNKVLVGLEPLALGVFDAVGSAMDGLGPAIQRVGDAFKTGGLKGGLEQIGTEFGGVWNDVIKPALGDLLSNLLGWVTDQAGTLKDKFVTDWGPAFSDWITTTGIPFLLTKLPEIVDAIIGWIRDNQPKLAEAWSTAAQAFYNWITDTALPQLQQKLPEIEAALVQFAVDNIPRWGALLGLLALDAIGRFAVVIVEQIGIMVFTLPPQLILLGVAMIGGLAIGLFNGFTDKVVPFFTGLGASILGFLSDAGSWLVSTGAAVMNGMWAGIQAGAVAVADFFTNLFSSVLAWIGSDPIGWLIGHGENLIHGLYNGIQNVIGDVISFFANLPGNVVSWLGGTGGTLSGQGSDFISGLLNGVTGAIGAVASFFASLPGNVSSWVGNTFSTLVGQGSDVISGFISGISGALGGIPGALGAIPGIVSGAVSGAAGWLYDIGRQIISGLISGIEGAAGGIRSAVQGAIDSAISSIPGVGGLLSKIPGLAVGGYVTKPTLAIVGESGPEYVIPADMWNGGVTPLPATYNATMPAAASAVSSGSVGDINIYAQTNADPQAISRELSWTLLTRGR